MALKRNIPGTTKYYYGLIRHLQYSKPTGDAASSTHLVVVELQVRDTTDSTFMKVENTLEYRLEVTLNVDPNDPLKYLVATDPLDLSGTGSNIVAQAYTWLKSNIALFSDFVDV